MPRSETSEKAGFILEQAAELFAQKGYEATSMRDIAQRAGVSKSLLYHHFKDKYQIYALIGTSSGLGLNEAVAQAVAKAGSARERLLLFMTTTAGFFEQNRLPWIAASQEFWSSDAAQMPLHTKLRRDSFERMLRDILVAGVDAGEFQIRDVRLAGRLILSSLNWMHRWYKPDGKRSAPEIAEEYFHMIVDGIGCGAGQTGPHPDAAPNAEPALP